MKALKYHVRALLIIHLITASLFIYKVVVEEDCLHIRFTFHNQFIVQFPYNFKKWHAS